ncbi:MAG: hypothetical protein MMC23_004137 [Stictis urceolatum]|nr:hypothetical protein [Stictis urceolata]
MPDKAAHTKSQGHKITASGWYRDRYRELENKYPNLRQSDFKRPHDKNLPRGYKSFERRGRACVLEFSSSGAAPMRKDFNTAEAAAKYLRLPQRQSPYRRLFVLEGLDPSFISVFGECLDVDPRVFSRHDRTGFWEPSHSSGNTPALASLAKHASTWDFWDLRKFKDGQLAFGHRVASDYRRIALFRGRNALVDDVGRVHRKASYWAARKPRDGWDVLLVVDPPIKALIGGKPLYVIEPARPEPYQGGYADFIPYGSTKDACATSGPQRESMLDDICYYWTSYHNLVEVGADPQIATIFLQKIIASHYMLLLEFLSARQNRLEWPLTRRNDLGSFDLKWVEQSWSELRLFSRRYVDDITFIETITTALGISETDANSDTFNSSLDFLHGHKRMSRLEAKCHAIIDAYSALASLVVGQQSMQDTKRSISEAKSVKALTWLASCFVPLSFICGIFSMNDRYLPGANLFWVYFVVALPLVAMTLSTVILFNRGYNSENQWSLQTWIESWKGLPQGNGKPDWNT